MAYIRARKRKKGTRYTASVRVAGYPEMSATFGRRVDAVAWAAKVEANIRLGYLQNEPWADQIYFEELLDDYLRKITSQKSENTQDREIQIGRQLRRIFGEFVVTDITPRLVAEYRDERLKGVGASTVRLELAMLSHIFRIARREWSIQVDNPVSDIKRPPAPEGRLRFLSQNEAERLLTAARESRTVTLYPYLLLMLHSAMRPSEAAGIRCSQVDLDRRIIVLPHTKPGPSRSVPLTQAVIDVLRAVMDGRDPDDYVFLPFSELSYRLETVPSRYFRKSFRNACSRAGIDDFRLHDLRHTAASYLLMGGVDLRTLAEILGHKTLSMVCRYTHLLDEHKLKAIDKIGGLGLQTFPEDD